MNGSIDRLSSKLGLQASRLTGFFSFPEEISWERGIGQLVGGHFIGHIMARGHQVSTVACSGSWDGGESVPCRLAIAEPKAATVALGRAATVAADRAAAVGSAGIADVACEAAGPPGRFARRVPGPDSR
jgi:hypothetical protein